MYTNSKPQQTNKVQNHQKTLQMSEIQNSKHPKTQKSKNPKIQESKLFQDSVDVKNLRFLDLWIFKVLFFLDFWIFGIFGIFDVWILGSFAFPVLLFDMNAASENEPNPTTKNSV